MEKNDLRRRWAESFAGGKTLQFVSDWWNVDGRDFPSSMTQLRGNVENPIGLAKIPIGLVGPVLIHGKHADGYVCLSVCPFVCLSVCLSVCSQISIYSIMILMAIAAFLPNLILIIFA